MDWGDRGTADGGSPDSQKGSRSPHQIQTTVGVSGEEGKDKILLDKPVFQYFLKYNVIAALD